ncbi:MAG TPA: MoaD/ThiS family protein [Candidatus Aerophobetes bacterium]|uniref:MoaD/ThiS family protein n=1 Tax=Aerophobetes bacterium TaxID=2030807 RepID=A0A7V5LZY2_UNCAE|nr:MoaD/ThiS family protein [Candidatus Aerophobetes bacterium]
MKVKVGNKVYQFDSKMRGIDLLKKLNLQPQSNIIIKNGEVITEDEYIEQNDEVEIINAISGG